MGYCVKYPGVSHKKQRQGRRKLLKPVATVILILLLFTAAIAPTTRAMLQEWIIPGDNRITVTAMEELIGNMKDGEDFNKAFAVFCETVLYGGA